MEQISADFHLISANAVQLSFMRKTWDAFNWLLSKLVISPYEMEQIPADFHLISRLSSSDLNYHSYKSY